MQGYSVVWVPGTDHAGIATQVVVEKDLYGKTKKSRKDVGREQFMELVLLWKAAKMNRIIEQLKQLGATLDWSRYTFTMDNVSLGMLKMCRNFCKNTRPDRGKFPTQD